MKCQGLFWPHWLSGMCVQLVIRRSLVQSYPGSATFFHEDGSEMFSTVILSFPLIQEGHLSVSGKKCAQGLVNG